MTIIVDDKQKWAHVSIPKCACTSIRRALESHFALGHAENPHSIQWPHQVDQIWLEEARNYYRWAVVRNPFERLVSTWQEKCVDYCWDVASLGDVFQRCYNRPFAYFVDFVCELPLSDRETDAHIRTMGSFLKEEGRLIVDETVDINDLELFWKGLQEKYRFGELGRYNVSNHESVWNYYTDNMLCKVASVYQDDIETFFPELANASK